jgi:hypothetical protein
MYAISENRLSTTRQKFRALIGRQSKLISDSLDHIPNTNFTRTGSGKH